LTDEELELNEFIQIENNFEEEEEEETPILSHPYLRLEQKKVGKRPKVEKRLLKKGREYERARNEKNVVLQEMEMDELKEAPRPLKKTERLLEDMNYGGFRPEGGLMEHKWANR